MGYCKKDVAPVHQQWSNIFLSLTYRYMPADALAPKIASASAGMVLAV